VGRTGCGAQGSGVLGDMMPSDLEPAGIRTHAEVPPRRPVGDSIIKPMSSPAGTAHVPVIDLSITDRGLDRVAGQIDEAASEYGFFYVTGHEVSPHVVDSILELSRAFFQLDDETKNRIHMSRGGRAWRGYFPLGGELTSGRPDLKEGVYFGAELSEEDARVRAGVPLHGRNLFPDIPGFREAVLDYMGALTRLGHQLMSLVGRGLGVGDDYFIDRYTSNPTLLFRIFNYPSSSDPSAESRGVGEHTDYGLLTLLYQDEVGGLQVKHGSSWLDVPYVPGSFVINLGDMLERLTSGRYTSALHRVINSSNRDRISMPFFFDPSFDAELEPIPAVGPAAMRRELIERWDGLDLRELRGTYGEYLIAKVSKVFPDLAANIQDVSPQQGSPHARC
jgi:isopenicillin N synthase-like dioxygenase